MACIALAGCGGSDESSNSAKSSSIDLTQVKAAVAAAQAPVPWKDPGPSFNAAAARGKSIAYVPINSTIPFITGAFAGFKEAMNAVGVNTRFFDTNGTPPDWSKAVEESIAQKVAAIVLVGADPGQIGPAIAAAKRANIPVIESFIHSAGEPITPNTTAEVTYSIPQIAKQMADYAILRGNGKVNTVLVETADSPVAKAQEKGIRAEFATVCPDTCKIVQTYPVPTSQWATTLPTLTPSIITAHPDLNSIMPLTDGMVQYMVPALKARGKAGSLPLISFNATNGAMSFMAAADNALGADVGNPLGWTGWILADQALRAATGNAPIASDKEPVPLRLFTKDNFTSRELAGSANKWYGDTDYASHYRQLWQLH